MKRKKKFKFWCEQENRQDLLDEWDEKVNQDFFEYDSPCTGRWKCENGHSYSMPVAMRTIFGLGCSICNPEDSALPIGTKYGCLTIIDILDDYEQNDYYQFYGRVYGCQCVCGQIHTLSQFHFLEKRHRYCGENCGRKVEHDKKLLDSYKQVKDESYDIDFTNTIHESLEIQECIDDNFEVVSGYSDKRKLGGGTFKVYKLYKCRCYLCNKEYQFKSGDFYIKNMAYVGYGSVAHCNCHKISSFQWRTVDILKKHNVKYKVEVSFAHLYGLGRTNLLRYDFAILDVNGNIKCLIECQGEQHYKPIEEFGGESQYIMQQQNDRLKSDYAKEHNIPLFVVPYTCDTYEKEEQLLKLIGII